MSAGQPGGAGYAPRRWSRSARLRPEALTRTRTWPRPGSGRSTSRSSSTSGPPGSRITTARIRSLVWLMSTDWRPGADPRASFRLSFGSASPRPQPYIRPPMRLPFVLDRPLVFLDLETTGLSTSNDRIIELAIIKVTPRGDVLERVRRFNPLMPIAPEATAVHGITDEDVRG